MEGLLSTGPTTSSSLTMLVTMLVSSESLFMLPLMLVLHIPDLSVPDMPHSRDAGPDGGPGDGSQGGLPGGQDQAPAVEEGPAAGAPQVLQ